jgi:beta-lactamase class C
MRKLIAAITICVITCGMSQPNHNQAIMQTILPALEEYIVETMQEQEYPGLAIAVVSKDKIHYLKTFGVKRLGNPDPVTADTLFQIGSISKAITSTLVARLQKQKLLTTNDNVSQHLPQFKLKDAQNPLKVWHILSHSTGVSGKGFNQLIEAYTPRTEIHTRLKGTPITAEPGNDFSYNNAMYSVVEDVMHSATGSPYHELLDKHLLTPLGMSNVSTTLDDMKASADRAFPHVQNKDGDFVPAKSYSRGYYAVPAAGGINASLNDLIPFVQLHLGKYPELLNDEDRKHLYEARMTDPEATQWMQDGENLITDVQYGLGWRLTTFEGEKIVFHGGWLKGFINFLAFLPEHDIGIIVLQNTETTFSKQVGLVFFDLYVNTLHQVHNEVAANAL